MFELLPTELRYYIISFFDANTTHNFAFVNKGWHSNEDIWKLLCNKKGIQQEEGAINLRSSWKQLFTENTTYVQVVEGWHCKTETVNKVTDDVPLHQVCMLGTGGVGLTAIIRQFLFKELFLRYDPTVEDMYFGTVIVNGERRNLEIIDTAGQEEYSALRDQYIKGYHIFVYVYSVTSVTTFNAIDKMVTQTLRAHEHDNIYGNIETTIYDRTTILHAFAALIKSFLENDVPAVRPASTTKQSKKKKQKQQQQQSPKQKTKKKKDKSPKDKGCVIL